MKPVKEYIEEHYTDGPSMFDYWVPYDLKQAGYYEYRLDWDHYLGLMNDPHYSACLNWLEENYPKDYYHSPGIFFFTNSDIATLMKLSVI